MKEEWRMCKGFEPFYMVSNCGRVKSVAVYSNKYQKILNRPVEKMKHIETTRDGYKRVLISYYGKHYHCSMHRLVAQAFIENPNNYPCINHKDENKSNNVHTNLEWCSASYNNAYGTRMQRVRKKVQQSLNGVVIATYDSMSDAGKAIGQKAGAISRCCHGFYKTCGGYEWTLV